MSGLLVGGWDWPEPPTIFAVVLLGVTGLGLLLKLLLAVARGDQNPRIEYGGKLERELSFDPPPVPQGFLTKPGDIDPLYRPSKLYYGGRRF